MQPFKTLTSKLAALPNEDIDTDQIIPAQYLKVTDKAGLAEGLFSSWRYRQDGSPDPDFPLNQPAAHGASILLAGNNFGCGSSREHAPWALLGYGFRAVISTSFADIFCNNAFKNGLLPVVVESQAAQELFDLVAREPLAEVTIDLQAQSINLPGGRQLHFAIDEFNKTCLLEGLDQLGYLLRFEPEIAAYEQKRGLNQPAA